MTANYPRTTREKAREAKHKAICNEFLSLTNQFPEASAHRIFGLIAERHQMTMPGIRGILVKAGVYTPKR